VHKADTLDRLGPKFHIGDLVKKDHRTNSSDTAAVDDPDGYDERVGGEDGREFGDHMSGEGETSHIPSIIILMYTALTSWAWLTSHFTGCSILTIPLFYVLGMIAFYSWHRMAHSEWLHGIAKTYGGPVGRYFAEMHAIHMEHHLERFPPSDFYGR
jgi:hypothetical protein